MTEKHLVTGSSGFLGQKTIRRLLDRNLHVVAVDIEPDPSIDPAVEFHQLDIRDYDGILAIMEGVSVVHHHAALVPLTKAYNDFWGVNVDGAAVVARAAKKAGVRAFMHTSSSAVYGHTKNKPIDSTTKFRPAEPYGKSKYEGELAVRRELEGSDIQLAIIRPRTVLGGERGGIFDLFFRWIREDKPIFTIGSGNNTFQFVHADDLLEAYFVVLEAGASGDFNVGAEEFGTLNQAFDSLIKYAGSKSRVVHLPQRLTIAGTALLVKLGVIPLAPYHYKVFHCSFYFDLSPLKALGWTAKYSNDEMFKVAYDSFAELGSDTLSSTSESSSPHRKPLDGGVLNKLQKLFDR